jgi:hypothetical protein
MVFDFPPADECVRCYARGTGPKDFEMTTQGYGLVQVS